MGLVGLVGVGVLVCWVWMFGCVRCAACSVLLVVACCSFAQVQTRICLNEQGPANARKIRPQVHTTVDGATDLSRHGKSSNTVIRSQNQNPWGAVDQ